MAANHFQLKLPNIPAIQQQAIPIVAAGAIILYNPAKIVLPALFNSPKVSADAVKKCFERTYSNNTRAASTLKMDSIEADGQTLTIHTPEANPTILNDLCDPMFQRKRNQRV